MKRMMLILAISTLMAGCTTNVALKDAADAAHGEGILRIALLEPNSAEIILDGKRFEGKWASSLCTMFTCPDVYGRVTRIHRRHLRKGQAEFKSEDGERLACEWISHLPVVEGSCRAQDGRAFRLVEAKPAR